MMGGHGGGGLLTLVERKSRFTRIEPVKTKHADHVAEILISALDAHKGQVHTLTMDNGNEFAHHETVHKELKAEVYFAIPIVLGSVDSTKIPTDSYASIFPREPTLKPSATLKSDRSKTGSTIGPEKGWDFEHQTRCFNPRKLNH